jgi:hypothetical protein
LVKIMPADWAKFIILYRQYGQIDTREVDSAPMAKLETVTIDFSVPAERTIRNPIDLFGAVIQVPAAESPEEDVPVQSPLGTEPSAASAQVAEVLDLVTVVPENRIAGRINVNEAPKEVLMTLPGMNAEIAETIVAERSDATDRRHPIWLWTEGLLDLQVMRNIASHVTCGGDVYRAHVWGYVDDQSPIVRFETVLDASQQSCRPVYYRELSAPRDEIHLWRRSESGGSDNRFSSSEQTHDP